MDKELLRIIIIATGLIIIIGMLFWEYLRDQRKRREMYELDDDEQPHKSGTRHSPTFDDYDFDDELGLDDVPPAPSKPMSNSAEADYLMEEFDLGPAVASTSPPPRTTNHIDKQAAAVIARAPTAAKNALNLEPEKATKAHAAPQPIPIKPAVETPKAKLAEAPPPKLEPVPTNPAPVVAKREIPQASPAPIAKKIKPPKVLQLSIVANDEEGFNGAELQEMFEMLGLEFGSVKVFERVDFNRLVDFCVASMSPQGIFPIEKMDEFYTPGITFFMQPGDLPDPMIVFDDMVRTIDLIARELNGTKLDPDHQPWTAQTVSQIRASLET